MLAKPKIHWLQDAPNAQLVDHLPSLVKLRLPDGWRRVSSSTKSWVATSDSLGVYFKAYLPRSWADWFKTLAGGRARREYLNSSRLRHSGIQAPEVLCWGKARNLLFSITSTVPGEGLNHYARESWPARLSGSELRNKRLLLRDLGKELARLHNSGIFHADLRPQNVMVYDGGFGFIDNDHNRFYRRVPDHRVLTNLRQLGQISLRYASRSDRLRVLRAYYQARTATYAWHELVGLALEAHRISMSRIYGSRDADKWTEETTEATLTSLGQAAETDEALST